MEKVDPNKLNTGPRTGKVRPELVESIRQDGLIFPILVDPFHVVIDGADRLAACLELGHTRVPVIVAESYDDAIDALAAVHDGRGPTPPRRVAEIHAALTWLLSRRKAIRAIAIGSGEEPPPVRHHRSREALVQALNLSAVAVVQNASELYRPVGADEPERKKQVIRAAQAAVDAGAMTVYSGMRMLRRWHLDEEELPSAASQRQSLSSTCVAIHGSTRALTALPSDLDPALPQADLDEWLSMLVKSRRAIQTTIVKIRRLQEASR
jgi:ParB-like nuclease family protein